MASAVSLGSRIALFLCIAIGGCALDLATKSWIFQRLSTKDSTAVFDGTSIVLVPGVFSLTNSLNEGALFGVGQGMTWAFAALSVLASIGIVYWLFFAGAVRSTWLTISLGLVMAGIFGNLYDRLGFPALTWQMPTAAHQVGDPVYAVRDWLHFEIRAIHFDWPVFNIADSMLVAGAIMLFCYALWWEKPAASKSAQAAPVNSQSN